MSVPSSCRALAAAALFLSAVSAGAAESKPASPPASATVGVSEARELVRRGRFVDALAVLRPLAKRRRVEANVLFLLGVSAVQASQQPEVSEEAREALLDEAVAVLRRMLIDRPDLVRVRLELARAFFYQGKNSLAREHFERVFSGAVPPPVVANVQRFLAEIRARRRWRFYLGAALAPNSNIGAASEEEIIYIYRLPFRRNVDELTTSGVGLSLWTGGEYQHPLADRFRLRMGGDLSRREYAGSEFDQTGLSMHVGPRWLIGERADLSLLASARRRLVAGDLGYDDLGFRTEGARRLTPRVSVNGRASWHDRRYRIARHLDGPIRDLSLGGNWVVIPTVRVDGGIGFGSTSPELVRQRNVSRWLRAGVAVALSKGFSIGGSGQYRRTDFEGNWFPFTTDGSPRVDRTRSLSASAHHRAFTLYGFSPQLVVTHENRRSNAQLHDYRRNHAELRLVRQF